MLVFNLPVNPNYRAGIECYFLHDEFSYLTSLNRNLSPVAPKACSRLPCRVFQTPPIRYPDNSHSVNGPAFFFFMVFCTLFANHNNS
ncbi:hypothetical protein LCGC14_3006600, partial [marine sediment metagenome]